MILNDEQKQKVVEWIQQGKKVAEIQDLLASEFGIRMTYMEVRLLIDDLKLIPKDVENEKPKTQEQSAKQKKTDRKGDEVEEIEAEVEETPSGKVSVTVDNVARPGAVLSGKVRFSDGVQAEWYLDEMGRLGLISSQNGYRPPESDIRKFQYALQDELRKLGML